MTDKNSRSGDGSGDANPRRCGNEAMNVPVSNDTESIASEGSREESHLSAQGACALPLEDSDRRNNTQTKSSTFLDELSVSRRTRGEHFIPHGYSSVTGCPTVPQGPVVSRLPGDTSQDICLRDVDRRLSQNPSSATSFTATIQSPSFLLGPSVNSCPAQQPHLQMNIPPSLPAERVNNTEIPIGIAEYQLSFQELPPSVTVPSALPPAENQLSTMPQSTDSSMTRTSGIEDNTSVPNLSVHNVDGSAHMTARLQSVEGAAAQAPAVSSMNHSQSQTSLQAEISPSCQLRKLPRSILKFIAVEMMNGWERLVELYGWNYIQTKRFASSNPNDTFLALLNERPFQTYTLDKFLGDLERIPRMDLLEDLQEEIERHNAEVQGVY